MERVDIDLATIKAVRAELHRVFLDHGPNLARLNENDLEVVSLRLARAAAASVPTKHCNCVYIAHCNRGPGCKLRLGGSVNMGGGVCPPTTAQDE